LRKDIFLLGDVMKPHKWHKDFQEIDYQQALLDATVDACLHGGGFILVRKTETGIEVKRMDVKDIFDLSKFILENRIETT
jgi:hypothetical protein